MDEPEIYTSTKEDSETLDYFKVWGIIVSLNAMVLISIYIRTTSGWSFSLSLPLVLINGYLIYLYFSSRKYHYLKSIVFHDSNIELIVLKEPFKNNTDMIFYFQSTDCIVQNHSKIKLFDFVFEDGHRYVINSDWFEDYDEIVAKLKSKNIPITEIEE